MTDERTYMVEMNDDLGYTEELFKYEDVPTAAQGAIADGAYDVHLQPWHDDEPDSWLRVRALPEGTSHGNIAAARAALAAE